MVARSVQQEKSALARGDPGFESILGVGATECATESIDRWCKVVRPDRALDRRAHGDLSQWLREPFGLHFSRERSHTEIAREQRRAYDLVGKRISWARKILGAKLSGYFRGDVGQSQSKRVGMLFVPNSTRPRGKALSIAELFSPMSESPLVDARFGAAGKVCSRSGMDEEVRGTF
ncbi:MAG: hypothetical protein EBE86_015710 [Hormoscilla sp. GUM202]|nr:hypothetical protein [Hormoscilla sp. GUM202]